VGPLKPSIPRKQGCLWVNLITSHRKKPSEKPHKLANPEAEVLTIEIVGKLLVGSITRRPQVQILPSMLLKTPPLRTKIVIEKIRPAWWPSSL
jgi:hypothetical protein